MADKLLLENGTDAFLLEDSSGVLLLDSDAYLGDIMVDSPVAYYRPGIGGYNSVLYDLTANAAHGDIRGYGGYWFSQPGPLVNAPFTAIALDGTKGYLDGPSEPSVLRVGDVWTVEFWFYTSGGAGTWRKLVYKYDYAVSLDSTNVIKVEVANLGSIMHSSTTYTTPGWHHVVASKNGSTRRLRIDKVDVTILDTNQTGVNSNNVFYIGCKDGTSEFWNGLIAEVVVYGTELSAARADSHYNTAMGVFAQTIATPTGIASAEALGIPASVSPGPVLVSTPPSIVTGKQQLQR